MADSTEDTPHIRADIGNEGAYSSWTSETPTRSTPFSSDDPDVPRNSSQLLSPSESQRDITKAGTEFAPCTWPMCNLSFRSSRDRDRHYQTMHANNGERPHRCLITQCPAGVKSWARSDKLRAHNKHWHGPYHCVTYGCDRGMPNGFASQKDLVEHQKECNPTTSGYPLYGDIPRSSTSNVSRGWEKRGSVTNWSRETSLEYSNKSLQEMPISNQKDSSSTQNAQGGYNRPRESVTYPPIPRSGSVSSPYLYGALSGDRASEDYIDPQNWYSARNSVAEETLSLDPRTSIDLSLPTRGTQYIPDDLPAASAGESSTHYQWEATVCTHQPNMQSNLNMPLSGDLQSFARNGQKSRQPRNRLISATGGNIEALDPSYSVRNLDYKLFFRPGRVFSMLWTDAFSVYNNDTENQFSSTVTYVKFGQKVHSKIRRFVVVKQAKDLRSCTCIPVTTYNGQGFNKQGINLSEHGAIFSSERAPETIKGVQKNPLKVRLAKDGHQLTNPSLINYGRVYTVECNVKVRDVGDLDSASRKLLRQYFKELMFDVDDPDPEHQIPEATDSALSGVGSWDTSGTSGAGAKGTDLKS